MGPLSFLIKPASGNCNLRCRYCFYRSLSENLTQGMHIMNRETFRRVIDRAMEAEPTSLTFAFQGGEPTLAGLSFFKDFCAYAEEKNTHHIPLTYAIQTNGQVIDGEWAALFKQRNFLVGLSLDGSRENHDYFRPDPKGEGSFGRVMAAADLMRKHGVEFNILCVVTSALARHPEKVYDFFEKNGFQYLQFIPCLDPIGGCEESFAPSPRRLGDFYVRLLERWYRDFMAGKYVSIRWFDNLLRMSRGEDPEQCGLLGYCPGQIVIEADGSVYPCDFYVTDENCLGNLKENTLQEITSGEKMADFIKKSFSYDEECKDCPERFLCRGGCRRDRDGGNGLGKTRLCETYRIFFPHWREKAPELLKRIRF